MLFLQMVPVIISLVILVAHFMRQGNLILAL